MYQNFWRETYASTRNRLSDGQQPETQQIIEVRVSLIRFCLNSHSKTDVGCPQPRSRILIARKCLLGNEVFHDLRSLDTGESEIKALGTYL